MTDLEDLGVQRIVLNLYKHFDRKRIEPTLILWQRRGRVASFLPLDASVHETDPGLPWPRFVFRLPRYTRILRQASPDAILSFVPGTNVSMALVKPTLRGGPALLMCEHAFLSRAFELREYRGAFRLIYRLLLRPMYNRVCDRLVMTAETGRDDAVRNWHCDERKIEIIYNPQDLDDLRSRAAETVGQDPWFENPSVPTFIGAGRLVEQKGFDSLIDAFARVRARRKARLAILGRGPLEEGLKQRVARLGLNEDVRFLGFQINHLKYIKRATAFVLSSRWEAMPMVMGETMAIGVPIVSFDCPSGPRELLGNGSCGFLVADQDLEALASKLEFVVDHPNEAAEKVRNALERVKLFDAKRVTKQYEDLVQREVTRRRARPAPE